jgi:ABC-2 type transport system ATP-binding protein
VITRWTGGSYWPTFFYWMGLGITLPRELSEENKKLEGILKSIGERAGDENALFESIPKNLPYRGVQEIRGVLDRIGLSNINMDEQDDCTIVTHYRSSFCEVDRSTAGGRGIGISTGRKNRNWIIKTDNLSKKYPGSANMAVDGLSMTIPEGTIYGILGPNGAGKTTTLSMLCGLLRPDGGTIEFSNKVNRAQLKRTIGYIPQDLALYPKLTGRDNLRFFGRLYDINGTLLKKRIGDLLSVIGLEERADDLLMNYSTGMKRRLNLAAGLLHDPQIILLDEPTVGIDPQSRNCIFESVEDLRRRGITILYTTHYMEEASRLCDSIAIMDHGKIVLEGEPDGLVHQYGLTKIDIDVNSPDVRFLRHLMKIENVIDVTRENGGVTVVGRISDGSLDMVEEIKKVARSHRVSLSLRSIRQPNLESLFLDITGRNLRDTDGTREI